MTDPEFVVNHVTRTYQFPDWLMRSFRSAEDARYEKQYYAPYDQLLNEHFKGRDGFRVCPVMYPVDSTNSVDFTVDFEVYVGNQWSPVFILEAKKPQLLTVGNKLERIKADQQMRDRYTEMLGSCPISRLHGISVFGTKVAFYEGNTATGRVSPGKIRQIDPDVVEDLAPYERWSSNDLLNPRCAYRLWQIFDEIHTSCRNLGQS